MDGPQVLLIECLTSPTTRAPGLPPPGESPTLPNYRFGEVVHMFFWSNRYHDRLYELGFTEAARNFQQDNFGRGGLGNDRVLAQAQDFSGTNNANFASPPDGISGARIFTGPDPDRTSGLDQMCVATRTDARHVHPSAHNSAGLGSGDVQRDGRGVVGLPTRSRCLSLATILTGFTPRADT